VKALTKKDMVEFFEYYISPSSPSRAKLAVHLHAQGTSKKSLTSSVEGDLKGLKLTSDDKTKDEAPVKGNGTTPYLIDDVRAFKSKLGVTPGPQPVRDLSEFEETDSKL
jgi:insulysin